MSDSTSLNTATVERYLAAFSRQDATQIRACLTEDVVWDIPRTHLGAGYAAGQDAFLREAAKAPPGTRVTTIRTIAAGDVVVVEGSVTSPTPDGATFSLIFCDVFTLREGKISRLTSYLAQPNDAAAPQSA